MTKLAPVSSRFPVSRNGQAASLATDSLAAVAAIPWKKSLAKALRPLLESRAEKQVANLLRKQVTLLQDAGKGDWRWHAATLAQLLQRPEFQGTTPQGQPYGGEMPAPLVVLRKLLKLALKPSGTRKAQPGSEHKREERIERELRALLESLGNHQKETLPPGELALHGLCGMGLATVWGLTANRLSPALQLEVWQHLFEHAQIVRQLAELPRHPDEAPLPALFLRGEWCCLLGLLFEEVEGFRELYRLGRQAFAAELDACTDNDGTPHAEMLALLPDWITMFTRQARIAKLVDRKFLSGKNSRRWQDLLQRCASLTASDGQLVLTPTPPAEWARSLGCAVKDLPPGRERDWATHTLRILGEAPRPGKTPRRKREPIMAESAATQSDWAHLACLRNNWYPGADSLAVSHRQPAHPVDLTVLGTPLLRGIWRTELQVNNTIVPLADAWSALCWYSEPACDFLEIRLQCGDITIDRQLFLSRTDHIALLSDSVRTNDPGARIDLFWNLPLAGNWESVESKGERGLLLKQKRQHVRVVPLALPRDRVHRAAGQVQAREGSLVADLRGEQNLCLPLLLDWSPERRNAECDWTQLTVTQERRILSPGEAFATRARIGKHQWVYLRNLEYAEKPRAVLGLHADAETIIAEFPRTGLPERLVEVHYEDSE